MFTIAEIQNAICKINHLWSCKKEKCSQQLQFVFSQNAKMQKSGYRLECFCERLNVGEVKKLCPSSWQNRDRYLLVANLPRSPDHLPAIHEAITARPSFFLPENWRGIGCSSEEQGCVVCRGYHASCPGVWASLSVQKKIDLLGEVRASVLACKPKAHVNSFSNFSFADFWTLHNW